MSTPLTRDGFATAVRRLALQKGISLRGGPKDPEHFGGYCPTPYRFVAIKARCDEDRNLLAVTDLWDGQETGNFLPTNCLYTVVTRNASARTTIEALWQKA